MKRVLVVIAVVLLGLVAFLWLWPLNLDAIEAIGAASQPASTYEEAVARVANLPADGNAGNTAVLSEPCPTQLRTHGQPTERVLVLFHGYTTCPAQWNLLADDLFAQGYNILSVRLPHHGYQDRMTDDLQNMTAEELAATATEAVDIAQGLGTHVTVAGFSTGGTMASWVAQTRADVDKAVIMSPFYGLAMFPAWTSRPVATLELTLPNWYMWWNPEVEDNDPNSPPYAYPQFSTRAMGHIYRLGFAVRDLAEREPLQAGETIVVLNQGDEAVQNELTQEVLGHWADDPDTAVRTAFFDAALALPHDYIDPFPPDQKIDETYPVILELITE
jgi:pimeloyl-ACP methyl ester carboxylesterase